MATTVHTPIRATIAAGATELFATDVAAGQQTRAFFLVTASAPGLIKVDVYAQSPTNTGDRGAGVFDKGGSFGRQVVIKTDAVTPVQISDEESLLVYITNLEDYPMDVVGFINGSF